MGGCESNVNEDSNEDLRILGNWDPKTQEKHCSTKLPMRTIRRKAGLFKADSMNWNPRTSCEVPEELRNKAFPWVEGALATFASMSVACQTDAEKLAFAQNNRTARAFLELMDELQTVLIQDMAALIVVGVNRTDHCLFDLELFKSPEFRLFVGKMRSHLQVAKAPFDASLQEVLPGVQQQFDAIDSDFHVLTDKWQEPDLQMKAMPQKLQEITELALNDLLMKIVSSVANVARNSTPTAESSARAVRTVPTAVQNDPPAAVRNNPAAV